MTTSKDRAADVIDRWTKAGGELNSHVGNPHSIAQELADAGLLMPDMTVEVDYRIVPADSNGGIYQTRRWTRHVTEWKPDAAS